MDMHVVHFPMSFYVDMYVVHFPMSFYVDMHVAIDFALLVKHSKVFCLCVKGKAM